MRYRYYYHYCSTNRILSDSSVFTSASPYSNIYYHCCKRVGSYSLEYMGKMGKMGVMGNNGKHTAKKCSSCATLI